MTKSKPKAYGDIAYFRSPAVPRECPNFNHYYHNTHIPGDTGAREQDRVQDLHIYCPNTAYYRSYRLILLDSMV